jgi:FkbM family methyltransferase
MRDSLLTLALLKMGWKERSFRMVGGHGETLDENIGRQAPPEILREGLASTVQSLCSKYRIHPRGIVHVGAHSGQELEEYAHLGVSKILFVEPLPELAERLRQESAGEPRVDVANCALAESCGTRDFYVYGESQQSSLFQMKPGMPGHEKGVARTLKVATKTLDSLLAEPHLRANTYNLLNVDTQGAELLILKGAFETLKKTDAGVVEMSYLDFYAGGANGLEVESFMRDAGFSLVGMDPFVWTSVVVDENNRIFAVDQSHPSARVRSISKRISSLSELNYHIVTRLLVEACGRASRPERWFQALRKLLSRRALPGMERIYEEFDAYLRILEEHNLRHKVLHTNAFFVRSSLIPGSNA